MGEVWTLAEFSHGKLSSVSNELLNRGKNLAEKLNTALASVVLGYNVKGSISMNLSREARTKFMSLTTKTLKISPRWSRMQRF